jgi:hypothetical protein
MLALTTRRIKAASQGIVALITLIDNPSKDVLASLDRSRHKLQAVPYSTRLAYRFAPTESHGDPGQALFANRKALSAM